MKTLLIILKWILILLILLFAIATFMGKSYLQTGILLLAVLFLAWWPTEVKKSLGKKSRVTRAFVVILLILSGFLIFPPEPKTSIYSSTEAETRLMIIYDEKVARWPVDTQDIFVETDFGQVHVLACGSPDHPPLMMFHAASMGAHSWAENLPPLIEHYHIYAVDNPGEGNKSSLNNPEYYPTDGKMLADMYAFTADQLGIEKSPVLGASNGGFIAMNYAYYHPEKVESLALFGPMGLTQLTGKSFMMLSIASMYPFGFVRDAVTHWALGKNQRVLDAYGDWFEAILHTMPSVAQPVPMTKEQKQSMDLPILLFLGTKDPIVGDAKTASEAAGAFPDITIHTLESGHLIAVEKAATVNPILSRFLIQNP